MIVKKNSPLSLLVLIIVIGISTLFIPVHDKGSNYPVNEQGQTYGHGPYPAGPSQEPDLLSAIGENGVVGYIKSSDLTPPISSPEEAIAYQKSMQAVGYRSIPLYKPDGITVIGEFRLH